MPLKWTGKLTRTTPLSNCWLAKSDIRYKWWKYQLLRRSRLISFPGLLWTRPKARSGKVGKFVFLHWLLHLTPVQFPLWKLTRFSAANFLQTQVLTWKFPQLVKKETPIGKDERRKDLEVICHSGWTTFATWSYRYLNPKHVIQRALKLPSISHTCFLTNTSPCSHFLALTRSPNLRTKTASRVLIPEAF